MRSRMNGSRLDGENFLIMFDDTRLNGLLRIARLCFERGVSRRPTFGRDAEPPPGWHTFMARGFNGADESASGVFELEISYHNGP